MTEECCCKENSFVKSSINFAIGLVLVTILILIPTTLNTDSWPFRVTEEELFKREKACIVEDGRPTRARRLISFNSVQVSCFWFRSDGAHVIYDFKVGDKASDAVKFL